MIGGLEHGHWQEGRGGVGRRICQEDMSGMVRVSLSPAPAARCTRSEPQDEGGGGGKRAGAEEACSEAGAGKTALASLSRKLRAGDIVGLALGDEGSRKEGGREMFAVQVVRVYPHAGVALVSWAAAADAGGGWRQKVVVVERDLWWRAAEGEEGEGVSAAGSRGCGGEASVALSSDENDSQEEEEEEEDRATSRSTAEAKSAEPEEDDAVQEEAAAAVEEDEDEEGESGLDSAAKIKAIKGEIEASEAKLKQERDRKLKIYQKQVDKEYKDGMRRVLKRMLLQYHPDKINALRDQEVVHGSDEEVEAFLKDITQELARQLQELG